MKRTKIYLSLLCLSFAACYDDGFDTGGFSVPSLITFEGGLENNVDPLLRNKLTFTAIDDIAITVSATNLDELAVSAIQEDGTLSLGTLPITNEQGTLMTSWDELGELQRLDFTGEAGSEQPYTKRLEIIRASPFILNYEVDGEEFITPGEVSPGEAFTLYYELMTANTPVEQVTFRQRVGSEGDFVPVETVTVNAPVAEQQQQTLTMPSAEELGDESLFVQAVVQGDNGLTYEEVIEISALP